MAFLLLFVAFVFAGPEYHVVRGSDAAALIAQSVVLGEATQDDPSSILQSVTSSGANIVATLEDPATVSDTPDEQACWSVPAQDAFGDLHSAMPYDGVLLRLWLGYNGLPPDVIVGAGLTTGALSTTSPGVFVTLQAGTSGATAAGKSLGSGASWTNTAATAGSVQTYGTDLRTGYITSGTGQMLHQLYPIRTDGTTFLLTSGSPAAAGSNGILGPWDTFSVCVGWRTGVGGTAGAKVAVSADLLVVPAAEVDGMARGAMEDANALPVVGGVIPSTVTILGMSNSHMQGAASGPVDTDFAGIAVQGGVTYRHNNGGAVTTQCASGCTSTVWGDREGSVPYLAEELKAAGVSTVRIVVNAGSGRSAQGALDNLGAAARDVYAMGTPAAPAQLDAIVWLGVPIGSLSDLAGYNEFLVDFPAVLNMLESHFPGVPIYAHAGIADSDLDGGPFWDEVDAAQQTLCAAHRSADGEATCHYFGSALPASKLDGTDHPTVLHGGGTDDIADHIMTALGMP